MAKKTCTTMVIMTLLFQINAFVTYKQSSHSHTQSNFHSSFGCGKGSCIHKMVSLDNLPKIFSEKLSSDQPSSSDELSSSDQSSSPSFLPNQSVSTDPSSLLRRAKEVLSSNMGIDDPSLLSPSFQWIGPDVFAEGSLGKQEYLAAGQFFYLNGAFPDLNYRPHDFRTSTTDLLTVRLTARTVGTMRGELRLRNEILPPNGKRMVCPPESISMTFDPDTGLLQRLCTGFTMDRSVGNTGGLCAVKAAATVAGAPPSEWEIYPPAQVVRRFFARPEKTRDEPDVFLAPFPETVMIQLAKGVLAAGNGVGDPTLLGDEFTFSGPSLGPWGKGRFLEEYGKMDVKAAFPDFEENYGNFRVDPYDPYRVWFDSRMTGTWTRPLAGKEPNGNKFVSPAEANSLTFDDDGFCTRMTAGYVMDPTDSNTGGLGGTFGIYYAIGNAQLPFSTRPLPQIIARTQTAALSVFTGADVDDFIREPLDLIATAQSQLFSPTPPPEAPSDDETPDSVSSKLTSLFARNDDDDGAESKPESQADSAADERVRKQEEFAARRKEQAEEATRARADAAAKRQAETAAFAERRAATDAAAVEGKKGKAGVAPGRQQGKKTKEKKEKKKVVVAKAEAPNGVPVLKRWKKNRDDSITGFITGSSAFSAGEKVTTSPIAKGELKSGNLVRTQSGSKYFLN